jgi:hypothetical protein
MQHAAYFGDDKVCGIVHYSTVNAVFTTKKGQNVAMEFHRFCGPMFMIDDEEYMPTYSEDPDSEWKHLWDQFEGWWAAKGKAQYSKNK